jgi:hypothetical protein
MNPKLHADYFATTMLSLQYASLCSLENVSLSSVQSSPPKETSEKFSVKVESSVTAVIRFQRYLHTKLQLESAALSKPSTKTIPLLDGMFAILPSPIGTLVSV